MLIPPSQKRDDKCHIIIKEGTTKSGRIREPVISMRQRDAGYIPQPSDKTDRFSSARQLPVRTALDASILTLPNFAAATKTFATISKKHYITFSAVVNIKAPLNVIYAVL